MSDQPQPTAALIIIGNEVLSGRTRDKNLAYLAAALNDLGIRLREARVVGDVEEEIVRAVNDCRRAYTYVFTTGGIGPTHDDITARSVAKALGLALERNAEAFARLEAHYGPRDLNEARLKMAEMPVGASLIHNPVSGAPGFEIGNVFVLAGIPAVMQAMFDDVKERLKGGPAVLSRTVSCFLREGQLAQGLGKLQADFPEVEIGSYPSFEQGRFGVSVVLRGRDEGPLARAADAVRALVRELGAEPVEAGG
jgi:molybdenum cofactor synthesis domain-containing protein